MLIIIYQHMLNNTLSSSMTVLRLTMVIVVAQSLIVSNFFESSRTVAHQVPLTMEFPQVRILERVAISLSRGTSQHRDRTHISCIAGRFFTIEEKDQPPGKLEADSTRPQNGWWHHFCHFRKSPPLPQNNWKNLPIHQPMKLSSLQKLAMPYFKALFLTF